MPDMTVPPMQYSPFPTPAPKIDICLAQNPISASADLESVKIATAMLSPARSNARPTAQHPQPITNKEDGARSSRRRAAHKTKNAIRPIEAIDQRTQHAVHHDADWRMNIIRA